MHRRHQIGSMTTTFKRMSSTLAIGLAACAACATMSGAARAAIYWANISGNTIGAADNNGTHVDQRLITGANGPADVLVSGHHIYWGNATGGCTESGSCPGSIGVANLNGTDVRENFIQADTPYGLAVDGQYIYWSNFGSDTIGRANLNGTGVNQDFIRGASSPDGVVVNRQHIYWSNSGDNTIGMANLNGSDADQSFITGANGPEGMAIDSQYIYWANHNDGMLGRAALNGTSVDQSFVTGAGNYPTRVAVTGTSVYFTTWTTNGVPTSGSIGEANLNGTDVNDHLIQSSNSPVGVTVTSATLPARCVVPNVTGRPLSAARKAIRAAHCAVGKVRHARSRRVKSGRVISQSRNPALALPAGTHVSLVVSKG